MSHLIALSPVKSESVEAIGHDGTTLAVKFKSGGLYHYAGVSTERYQELLKAKSIGTAMGEIKAKHKCTVIK